MESIAFNSITRLGLEKIKEGGRKLLEAYATIKINWKFPMCSSFEVNHLN